MNWLKDNNVRNSFFLQFANDFLADVGRVEKLRVLCAQFIDEDAAVESGNIPKNLVQKVLKNLVIYIFKFIDFDVVEGVSNILFLFLLEILRAALHEPRMKLFHNKYRANFQDNYKVLFEFFVGGGDVRVELR